MKTPHLFPSCPGPLVPLSSSLSKVRSPRSGSLPLFILRRGTLGTLWAQVTAPACPGVGGSRGPAKAQKRMWERKEEIKQRAGLMKWLQELIVHLPTSPPLTPIQREPGHSPEAGCPAPSHLLGIPRLERGRWSLR